MTGQERSQHLRPEATAKDLHDYLEVIEETVSHITPAEIDERLEQLLRRSMLPEEVEVEVSANTPPPAIDRLTEAEEDPIVSEVAEEPSMADLMERNLSVHMQWSSLVNFKDLCSQEVPRTGSHFSERSPRHVDITSPTCDEGDIRTSVEWLRSRLAHLEAEVFQMEYKLNLARKEHRELRASSQMFWTEVFREEKQVREVSLALAEKIEATARKTASACQDQALDELSRAQKERQRAEAFLDYASSQALQRGEGKVREQASQSHLWRDCLTQDVLSLSTRFISGSSTVDSWQLAIFNYGLRGDGEAPPFCASTLLPEHAEGSSPHRPTSAVGIYKGFAVCVVVPRWVTGGFQDDRLTNDPAVSARTALPAPYSGIGSIAEMFDAVNNPEHCGGSSDYWRQGDEVICVDEYEMNSTGVLISVAEPFKYPYLWRCQDIDVLPAKNVRDGEERHREYDVWYEDGVSESAIH